VVKHETAVRLRAVRQIQACFPPDAKCPAVARIGRELLAEAQRGFEDWKLQPTIVLTRLARLNRAAARTVVPIRSGRGGAS
jgi:hypothetical protein